MELRLIHIIRKLFGNRLKSKNDVGRFTNVEQLRKIMPGLLNGYLIEDEMPDSLLLLLPPPIYASEAYELDLKHAKIAIESKDEARFIQAAIDADLSFPGAVKSFESVLDVEINEVKMPKLYVFMRRVMTDAGLSTYAAKNHYNRERPFMVNNAKTCTPEQEAILRVVGSFPSGHAAVGWAWALILSEIFPDKEKVILKRGHDFGQSRIVCNAHWHSDVEMGRIMGKATVESLYNNSAFQIDLAGVKEEVFKVLGRNG